MSETFDPRCVWFVGAGPGDRELITLKGYRLLQQAQVVIYAGSLINTELLDYCPAQAERYDSAELHLEQIIELMAAGVKAGKTVVRLQTGDVSLYGSVREQGEELTRRGIDWQVVPGVSAFLGAAAELGVEYTVPEDRRVSLLPVWKGVRQYRRANNWRRSPVTRRRWRFISPFSVFTEWRNVSLPAVIRQLRLSRSSIRLPGRKARPFAAR